MNKLTLKPIYVSWAIRYANGLMLYRKALRAAMEDKGISPIRALSDGYTAGSVMAIYHASANAMFSGAQQSK